MRKLFSAVLVLMMLVSLMVPSVAAAEAKSDDIVILYTNDVHTYVDKPLGYDVLKSIKDDLKTQYKNVLLVDAGDHVQGTAYGSMDKGEHVVKLMNAAGYDAASLGNHEFDYGMEGCLQVQQWAEFPYLDCNFYHEENGVRGENVLDSYKIFDCGDEKVAIVGVLTPESFTKSTPAYFQDDNGNYIYGIAGGEDGAALYADVQKAVDDARAEGATKVIGLGHLGIDPSSEPWTSTSTIANVSGLDAFIDGHSHSEVKSQTVNGKDGKPVVLTQTGSYFDNIGMLVIHSDGTIETDLITTTPIEEPDLDENGEVKKDKHGNDKMKVVGYNISSDLYKGEYTADAAVQAQEAQWVEEIQTQLGEVIGKTDLTLDNYDGETRLVRSQETNTGDFAADALYYLFDNMGLDVDVAVMNGGGVRNKAITGDISYLTCKNIHTFGNVACLQTVTGQQILDALEWGARTAGTGEECGGFLQVSGITYKIDGDWPESLQKDDKGVWVGAPTGGYRVHDVKVYNKETNAWDDLDLNAKYNLAGYNYTLRELGDGFNMFSGAVNVLDYVMEDYMVLANYVEAFPDHVVEASNSPLAAKYPGFTVDYGTVNGSGRIVMEAAQREEAAEAVTEAAAQAPETEAPTTAPAAPEKAESHVGVTVAIILAILIPVVVVVVVVLKKKKDQK